MGLRNWLTDLFGVKIPSKRACLEAVRDMVRRKIASDRRGRILEAKANQMWEDILFRERYFLIKREEILDAHEYEARIGKKHSGFWGLKFYPPYTVWHPETAKYLNPENVDREWEESPLANLNLI